MNTNKHVWEGWTVQHFIDELEGFFDLVMNNQSHVKPFKDEKELKEWCKDSQPYYKKHIPEVYKYFLNKWKLRIKQQTQ